MAGVAGIVHWDRRPVVRDSIARMLDVVRHRGPDGLDVEVRGAVGFGHARFVLHDFERGVTQPLWLPDGSCGLVADARLYNRRELLSALGDITWFAGPPTDAQLVLAAYERWHHGAVQRIRGDFAFAVWDDRRQRLFAARDPFGVKPLFYTADTRRFCLGSEAKQLLAVPGMQARPNQAALARLLVNAWPSADEATFFDGILRLLPGHCLEAGADGVRVWRWWDPTARAETPSLVRDEEYAERFHELFRDAVARRLRVDCPVALELSGGYDSSSVVIAAAEIKASGSLALPKLVTLSQDYPGLPCDESDFISAVLAASPFPAIRYDAPQCDYSSRLHVELHKADAPYPDTAWARRELGSAHLSRIGCRVSLTGFGGDELAWDPDYELDLWRAGQPLRALRYCLRDPRVLRTGEQRECLARLARFAMPRWLKTGLRPLLSGATPSIPAWLTAPAAEMASPASAAPIEPEPGFPSMAQASVYRWLNSSRFHWLLESEELLAAWHGIELRHPFLDQDLAEFVLSIPWQARFRQPGPFKTLLVAAMGPRLPPPLRARHGKVTFESYFDALEALSRAAIEGSAFGDAAWASGRLIDRNELREACARRASHPEASSTEGSRLWLALMTELWMRQLS